jgi:xanthine dehydrogenase accessory factor
MKHAVFQQLLAARADKRPVVLVTELESGNQALVFAGDNGGGGGGSGLAAEIVAAARDALRAGRSAIVDQQHTGRTFLHVFNPPLRLFVVGAVHIAQALAPMAAMLGYGVAVIDPRRAFATPERFAALRVLDDWPDEALAGEHLDARSAVVTLTHDPKLDDPALAAALRSDAFYIGCLGSRRTHAKRLQRLTAAGFEVRSLDRLHGPVGLDIGASSPAEIATAILAEMTQTLRRGGPG